MTRATRLTSSHYVVVEIKREYFSFSGDGLICLAFVTAPLRCLLTLEIECIKKKEREREKRNTVVMNMQMPYREKDVDLDFTVLALAPQKL